MCVTGATCVPSWGDYCTGGSETEGGGCWGPASPQPCLGTSITPTLPMGMSPPKRAAWATHVASSPLSPPQPAWGSRWGHPKAICLPDWGQAEGAGDQFPHPHLSRRQSCPHRSCCHLPDPSRVSLPCLGHLPRSPRPGGGVRFAHQICTHGAGPMASPGSGLGAFCSPFRSRRFNFGANPFQRRARLPARLSAEISHP